MRRRARVGGGAGGSDFGGGIDLIEGWRFLWESSFEVSILVYVLTAEACIAKLNTATVVLYIVNQPCSLPLSLPSDSEQTTNRLLDNVKFFFRNSHKSSAIGNSIR